LWSKPLTFEQISQALLQLFRSRINHAGWNLFTTYLKQEIRHSINFYSLKFRRKPM
jgi:hypothetical protein